MSQKVPKHTYDYTLIVQSLYLVNLHILTIFDKQIWAILIFQSHSFWFGQIENVEKFNFKPILIAENFKFLKYKWFSRLPKTNICCRVFTFQEKWQKIIWHQELLKLCTKSAYLKKAAILQFVPKGPLKNQTHCCQ